MFGFRKWINSSQLSLIVQGNTIRLLQYKKIAGTYIIERVISQVVEASFTLENQSLADERLSQILLKLKKEYNLKGEVTCSLPDGFTQKYRLDLPLGLNRQEINQEIDNYVSERGHSSGDICVDYHAWANKTNHRMEILIVLAKKMWVSPYVTAIKNAGLQLTSIDVNSFAEIRLVKRELWSEKNLGLFYCSGSQGNLVIFSKNNIGNIERWEWLEEPTLNQLQLKLVSLEKFNQFPLSSLFFLTGASEPIEEDTRLLKNWVREIQYVDPLESCVFKSSKDKALLLKTPADFYLNLGLMMR